MRTDSKKLLFDIARACRSIQEFNAGGSLAEYSADAMRRAATERMFEIIGEAVVRLRERDPETCRRISDAHAITAFRNRLIHGYDLVDEEVVWNITQDKVSRLLGEVDALLLEPESPQTEE
jgi:uncharacterized protein with HEPN domain